MGSGGSSDSKTTTQNLTPQQQQLADLALPNAQAFAASNPTLPTGDQAVAPFDPNQVAGQNSVLNSVPQAQKTIDSGANANQFLTSGAALDPATNPSLAAYQKSAVKPIYDNLNETTLPNLSANTATGAGGISANVGGSREGIAQGLATKAADETAGSTEANIANAGYGQGLNAMLSATGQAPTIAASSTIPGTIQSTVGDVQQQQQQSVLNANNASAQFAQFLPMLKAQFLTQLASGTPGGSTTAVGTSNTDANPISQVIGGASAAGGLAGGLSKLLPLLMV